MSSDYQLSIKPLKLSGTACARILLVVQAALTLATLRVTLRGCHHYLGEDPARLNDLMEVGKDILQGREDMLPPQGPAGRCTLALQSQRACARRRDL